MLKSDERRMLPEGPWKADIVYDEQIRDASGRLLCVVVPTELSFEEFEAVKALILAASATTAANDEARGCRG